MRRPFELGLDLRLTTLDRFIANAGVADVEQLKPWVSLVTLAPPMKPEPWPHYLMQMHMHTPSEHWVDGESSEMELHIVFKVCLPLLLV